MTKLLIRKTPMKNIKYIKSFFDKIGIKELNNFKHISKPKIKKIIEKKTYGPNLSDLYSLYNIIITHKRTTVLEFGSGWSSLIISYALQNLKKKYSKEITKIRRSNPFELFIIENEKKYLNETKKKLKKLNEIKIHYTLSKVKMINYKGKFATEYSKLPLCNPDFIYLDGPDQYNIKKSSNNFSTAHPDLMPMVADILKMEYFLLPGTIILIDGRGANARFLKNNLERKWGYKYLEISDQHFFVLNDKPIGKLNKKQINFYNSK
tara:strand:+ start:207 stop:998 length:792 start_codon:yes stop_codon:yes gene_type:complete